MESLFRALLLLIIPVVCTISTVSAQIHYSNHFTRKIRSIGGEFIRPVEGYYKVKMMRRDQLMRYDLVLDSQEREFEMRFWIDPKYEFGVPHVSAFRLVSSLASNDPHFDISFNIWPPDEAQRYFNATWAAYVEFIPKKSFSEKHFGRLVCIYRPKRGMMYTVLLFNRHDEEKDRRLYTLQFQPQIDLLFPGK